MIASLVLIAGLVLLAFSSDWFVVGAARLSSLMRVPAVIVGAVVVGFGTSAPELLVALLASLEGQGALAMGNVIGSNLANLTLVLGTAAVAAPIVVDSGTVRREAPVSTAAVCLFGLCAVVGLDSGTGLVLGAALVGATVFVVRAAKRSRASEEQELVEEVTRLEEGVPRSTGATVALTVVGLAGTLLGAHLAVTGAVDLALTLGLSEGFVGLTIVAIGTSLPELVTSVQAVRRGEDDLIVGNVLGSNLFNSLGAGAIIAIASGGIVADGRLAWSVALMVVVALVSYAFMAVRPRFSRREGTVLLVSYAACVPLLSGG